MIEGSIQSTASQLVVLVLHNQFSVGESGMVARVVGIKMGAHQ